MHPLAHGLQITYQRRAARTSQAEHEQQSASVTDEGLRKQFGGEVVLRDLALSVASGAIFGLLGSSGSGKSTCIHLCCGHPPPLKGCHFCGYLGPTWACLPQQEAKKSWHAL